MDQNPIHQEVPPKHRTPLTRAIPTHSAVEPQPISPKPHHNLTKSLPNFVLPMYSVSPITSRQSQANLETNKNDFRALSDCTTRTVDPPSCVKTSKTRTTMTTSRAGRDDNAIYAPTAGLASPSPPSSTCKIAHSKQPVTSVAFTLHSIDRGVFRSTPRNAVCL